MSVTNRKVVITKFGDASNLAIVDEELPAPSSNEVQVSILYAGFAGADINMRLGIYPFQRSAPLTPGYCFVGRVRANGAGSTQFAADSLVCAMTVYDSDAHFINIPEKHLIRVPPGVDPRQAVALVLDWSTAYGMVHRHARVRPGQRVFVHGLSGAVGQALLSLCRLAGAEVYGTASARNHDALVCQGARPFAYTDKAWVGAMQALGGAHAVFDPLGFESFDESWSVLCADEPATLVAYGTNLNSLVEGRAPRSPWPSMGKLLLRNTAFWSKRSAAFFMITRDQKTFEPELRTLLGWLEEGKITVPIKKVWDMEDVRQAHEGWGKAEGMGSLVLRVSGE